MQGPGKLVGMCVGCDDGRITMDVSVKVPAEARERQLVCECRNMQRAHWGSMYVRVSLYRAQGG